MSDELIEFSFKETQPDLSTFKDRFLYFVRVTNLMNFFVPATEIRPYVEKVKMYKNMAKMSPDGKIYIPSSEKQKILRGIELMNSTTNDSGETVFKPF